MNIQYLSWLRNRIGKGQEQVEVPAEVRTLKHLAEWLSGRGDAYKATFSHQGVITASVNGQLAEDWEKNPVSNDDKICFFSPLAGG